jgi:hypothetical protein
MFTGDNAKLKLYHSPGLTDLWYLNLKACRRLTDEGSYLFVCLLREMCMCVYV